MRASLIRDKENMPIHREKRLSLKTCQTAKKKPQIIDGRMSMLPLKKQRLSIGLQQSQARISLLPQNLNLLNLSATQSSCQKSLRRSTIINNLVNKLDQQQQIRSIIQTKLKKNTYGKKQFVCSEFHPYGDDRKFNATDQINHMFQANDQTERLRQCQDELRQFRDVVRQLQIKIKHMENNQSNQSDYKGKFAKKCSNCDYNNSCSENKQRSIGVQTQSRQQKQLLVKSQSSEMDFFQNLDKTLKILDKSRQLR